MKKILVLSTFLFVLSTASVNAVYTCLGGGDHSGADWTPATDCASGEVAGTHTNIGTLYVNASQTVTVKAYDGSQYGSVNISANTATIADTGTITANGKGYRGLGGATGEGPGGGTSRDYFCGSTGGGGAYGGYGSSAGAAGGSTYGSATAPVDLGSAGGASSYGGSNGGGAIRITTTGTLTVAGTISTNGNGDTTGGAGSGGSVYLTTATLAGAGSITANGGNAGCGGGGGGGRIAIYFSSSNTYSGTISASVGTGGSAASENRGYGTAFIEDTTNNDITVPAQNGRWAESDRGSWSFRNITINSGVLFQPTTAGSTFTISSSGTTTFGSSTYTVYLKGYNTTSSNGRGVHFNLTGNVTLPSTVTISADSLGYAGGSSGNGEGPGAGTSGNNGGGGGYGGAGSNGVFSGSGGSTYGSATVPVDLGSGAGSQVGGYVGGSGGGAIRITTTGTLTVTGAITANGGSSGSGGGGGSGGSIFLTASVIAGAGSITANGGNGATNGGGGGGGRVRLNFTGDNLITFSGTMTASLGSGGSGGSAGTTQNMMTAGGDHGGANWTISSNASIAGVHTNIGTFTVNSGITATVQAYDGTNFGSLNISATTATIAGTGIITADGKGYRGGGFASSGEGTGGGTGSGSTTAGAGGYGGVGSSAGVTGGTTYGSATAPTDMGSGGGSYNGSSAGNGGGAIRITTTGTLTNSGTISANGADGGCSDGCDGAGSGGSVYLTAGTLAGAGPVTANGGNGGSAGGGGGRIAIYFSTANSYSGTISVNLGTGGTAVSENRGYGTAFIEDTTNNDITFPAQNGKWAESDRASWSFRNLTINSGVYFQPTTAGSTLTISSSGTTTFGSSTYTVYLKGYNTTSSNGKGVYLNLTGNVTIPSTVTITANGLGYLGVANGNGDGPGGGIVGGSSVGGGGGGYGGTGSSGYGAGGSTYGSATAPVDLGSAGGGYPTSGYIGGNGGGAIRIATTGTLTVSGTISTNGNDSGSYAGGGSGGSIYLTAATMAGAGSITANGGAGANGGGGGGGGRIAIYFTSSNTYSGTVSVTIGSSGTAASENRGYGTAFIQDTTNSDITIPAQNGRWAESDRTSWSFRDVTINSGVTFQPTTAGSTFIISSSGTTTFGSSTYTVFFKGYNTTSSNGKGVYLNLTGNVTIPSTVTFSANGLGYAVGGYASNGDGPGGGGGSGSTTAGGGGYGGAGLSGGASGGSTYGSATSPVDLGSGGGTYNNGSGTGDGGGAIRLSTTGTLTVSGTISANGEDGGCSDGCDGAGSGGSIYLTAGTFAGAGAITANGGNGGSAGGGGGRIAIYYTTSNTYSGTPTVTKGTGGSGGADGTITGPSLIYAPTLSSLVQYQSNCTTSVSTGGNLEGITGCFKASLSDTDNPDTLYLEVEVKALGTAFNNFVTAQGAGTAYSGSPVTGSVSTSSGIAIGTSYHWQVRVVDTHGAKSAWTSYGGNAESAADFVSIIPAPTGVTNTYVSDTQIDIAWTDNSVSETSFKIERNTNDGGYSLVYTTAADAQSWSDTTTSANNKYQYRVRATDGTSYSDYGTAPAAVYTTPAAPTGAGISQTAAGSITVTWTDASNHEANFEVQRDIAGGGYVSLSTSIAAGATSYTDTTVQQNATYTYRVRATRTTPNALNSSFSTSSGLPISQGFGKGLYITATGRLIGSNAAMGEVNVWSRVQDDTTDQTGAEVTYDESNPSNGPVFASAPVLHDLAVRDEVIYAAADSGLTAIRENLATPASGSVKYYTKDYISEEMVGNIQGMWGFNSSLNDTSVKSANLSAGGATITYPSGVRGTGINITVANATATVTSIPANYSFGTWVNETDGWHHYVKTNVGEYKDGLLQASSFTSRMTWATTTVTLVAGTQDLDEAFATATTLSADQIRTLYATGYHALQNHTASRITGISGADSYQKLQGSVNPVYAVAVDAANQYLYVGTNDTTTNTGALTILGTDSDSVVDLYSTANTGKTDSAGTAFAANDILALSVAGTPNPAFRGESDKSAASGLLALVGTNDTASRLWIEGQTYSLGQVLAAVSGPGSVKEVLSVSQVFRVGNSQVDSLSPTPGLEITQQGTIMQNYLGSDANTNAVSFSSSTLTSGSLMSLTNSNLDGTSTTLYLKHYATGSGNLAFRVDDVSGDTTPFVIDGLGNVGIGTTSPLTALQVVGSASASANLSLSGQATAHTFNILDSGTLNIQRSVGGDAGLATSLFIDASGNTGIGTTAPTALLQVAGTASISGALNLYGTTTIQSTANKTLTLGGNTTGNIVLSPLNSIAGSSITPGADNLVSLGSSPSARFKDLFLGPSSLHIQSKSTDTGYPDLGIDYGFGINTSGSLVTSLNGTSNSLMTITQSGNLITAGSASVSGALTLYGTPTIASTNKQTLTIGDANTGNIVFGQPISSTTWNGNAIGAIYGGTGQTSWTAGQILYASGTDTLAKLNIGNTNDVLTVIGGIPSWQAPAASGGSNWRITTGAISPNNDTLDVLFGSSASASAKFAFLNINSGTPTASIAGNLTLDSAGILATTKNQSLSINPNGGNVGIGTLTPAYNLDVAGNSRISANATTDDVVKTATADFTVSGSTATNVTTTGNQITMSLGTATATTAAGPTLGASASDGAHSFQRPDGKFIVVLGNNTTTTNIYDPSGNSFSSGPALGTNAYVGGHAIQRPDGKFVVLVGNSTATNIYDPADNTFSAGPALTTIAAAGAHSFQRQDGKFVVIIGGSTTNTNIYDPAANTFSAGPALGGNAYTGSHSIQRPDGKFVVVIGNSSTSRLYDPSTNSFSAGPALTTTINYGSHSFQRPDGKFITIIGNGTATTNIYDPSANTFSAGPDLTAVAGQDSYSVQRPDGKFLTILGNNGTTTNIYDPSANTFSAGAALTAGSGPGSHAFQRADGKFVAILGNATTTTNLIDLGWNTSGSWESEPLSTTKLSINSSLTWNSNPQQSTNPSRVDQANLIYQVRTTASTCNQTNLDSASYVTIKNNANLIPIASGAICAQIKISFNSPIPAYPTGTSFGISQNNDWAQTSNTTYFRVFQQPTVYDITLSNPIVARGGGDVTQGNSFATQSATLENVVTTSSNTLALQTDKNINDNTTNRGIQISIGPALANNAASSPHAFQRPDGKSVVILSGGSTTTNIYDPAANTFSAGPALTVAAGNGNHSFQRPDGKFVVILGNSSTNTNIYDPTINGFSAGPALTASAFYGAHTFLRPDGKFVTILGNTTTTTNIYDPATNSFTAGPALTANAYSGAHSFQRPDGRFVTILGNTTTTTNIYDPTTNTFVAGPALTANSGTNAQSLQRSDGKFLIILGGGVTTTNIYDPRENTFVAGPTLTAAASGGSHSLQRPDGKFLVILGGTTTNTNIYDPATNTFSAGPATSANANGAFSLQRPDGKFVTILGNTTTNTSIIDVGWNLSGTYITEPLNDSDLSSNTALYWKNIGKGNIGVKVRSASSAMNLGLAAWSDVEKNGSLVNPSGNAWIQIKFDLNATLDTFPGAQKNIWGGADTGGLSIYLRTPSSPILHSWKLATSSQPSILTLASAGQNLFRFDANGSAYTSQTGAWYSGGADIAEYYSSSQTLEAGEVVALDQVGVVKSYEAYQDRLLGVVSTQPGFVAGAYLKDGYPIALSGRVPVKIDPDSPPINVGDFLTSSNKSGLAQKATQSGYTIGKALGKWEPGTSDRVEIFVSLGWYVDPTTAKQTTLSAELWTYATASGKLVAMNPVQVPELTVTGKLHVGLLDFDDLSASISSVTGTVTVTGDLAVTGSIKILGSSAGKDILSAGLTSVVISNPNVATTSAIFVTPEKVPVPLSTESTESGKFVIRIPAALPEDLTINWWISN